MPNTRTGHPKSSFDAARNLPEAKVTIIRRTVLDLLADGEPLTHQEIDRAIRYRYPAIHFAESTIRSRVSELEAEGLIMKHGRRRTRGVTVPVNSYTIVEKVTQNDCE